MPQIQIGSQLIDFPDSGESPNWAEAMIQFAEAVAEQLSVNSGTYDVSPQSMTIDAYNTATNQDITNLNFPTANVRAAFIYYTVYRTTSTDDADEAGQLVIVYNPNNSTGFKWTMTQVRDAGNASISFNVTDTGQVQFTTTALSGSSHAGKIGFFAKAIENA